MRRQSFTEQSVDYGAIGATTDPDLMRYPPEGFKPAQHTIKLGSGQDRFDRSVEALMTWGIQRGAHLQVSDVQEGTGEQYLGIVYDDEGVPLEQQPGDRGERHFAADGTPYVAAGMTATIARRRGLPRFRAQMLVVYVVDEPDRVGFAYGTVSGAPMSGEESFVIEHREDDTVWLTIRAFHRPAGTWSRIFAGVVKSQRKQIVREELVALHPVGAV
ncbi:hypothetical protein ARHIZOSPH14_32820 [Agromyces rhizosphaerae]|uniref:DUF1990 domain-containing protein n=1 Tax=Agromyces rhizosphaerae TaxID=88374 RepID=A0A9W6FQZ7_9MICO|nr:DUF1990 domain-containing protein [Agromyces rhizosphaerae]GLI29040.1 hypothetical protein ARHIZOSPH14_32820 [Agromyces rhizosphaerae]